MSIKHLYPTSTPALNLNPKSSRVADPRLSCVRNSIGTYVDPVSGLVKTAPANVARVEKGGLLVEATRTNETNNSEVFTDTGGGTGAWTANSTTAPDGNTTAYLWIPVSGFVDRNAATLSNQINGNNAVLVASVFVKKKELRYAHIALLSSATYYTRLFDLDTGEFVKEYDFGSPTKTASHVTALTNGWYRISVAKYVANTETTARLQVGSTDVSNPNHPYGQVTYTADGTSGMYFWGAQLEEWASPSSYIPTSGSTVQRLADEITLPTSGIFDPNEFTTINKPFGVAAGSDTLTIIGDGNKAECTFVYNSHLSQTQANAAAGKTDDWWEWRVLGGVFALANFTTDGVVKVDWGDGTAIETLTTAAHTFTTGGGYHTIKFRLDSGTYFQPRMANNHDHSDKVISVGPLPESMGLECLRAFDDCRKLTAVDAVGFVPVNNRIKEIFRNCRALKSIPYIDTSSSTNFDWAFHGVPMTKFPRLDLSSATSLQNLFHSCDSLTEFPEADYSNATDFYWTWYDLDITGFPVLDLRNATRLQNTWANCRQMIVFSGALVRDATTFRGAWAYCTNLTTFPAGFWDNWTGTPASNCLRDMFAFAKLSATSLENVLTSLANSGQSAPASGTDIDVGWITSTGVPYGGSVDSNGIIRLANGVDQPQPIVDLKSRGWTPKINNVYQ